MMNVSVRTCIYSKRKIQNGTYCFTVYTVKFTLFLYLISHSFPVLTSSISDLIRQQLV